MQIGQRLSLQVVGNDVAAARLDAELQGGVGDGDVLLLLLDPKTNVEYLWPRTCDVQVGDFK